MSATTTNNTNVSTGNAYFDLNGYISSVKAVDVAAQMASSVAFAVDLAMAGTLRQIMKNIRAHHDAYGYDSVGAMTDALRDLEFAEEVFREHGKAEAGLLETFAQLLTVRDQWHDLARGLTGMTFNWDGTPRTYKYISFEEFLSREVDIKVQPTVERRIRIQVQRRADGASKDDIDTVVARRMQREQDKAKDVSRALTEQSATLLTMYDLLADKAYELAGLDPYAEEFGFHELDAKVRAQLINAALKGAARAEEYATSSRSITDDEFDQVSFAVIKIERELKTILTGPAYRMTSV